MKISKIVLLVLVAGVLTACGSDDSGGGSNNNDATESETPAAEETDSGGGGAAQKVKVTATDFEFDPTELSVDPGAEVSVSFQNDGNTTHTFTIEDVVDVSAPAGSSTDGSFTAPDSGSLEYICTIHPSMKGTLSIGGSAGSGGGGGEDSDKSEMY